MRTKKQNYLSKKSVYMAVILATQSMLTVADEQKKNAPALAEIELKEVQVRATPITKDTGECRLSGIRLVYSTFQIFLGRQSVI